jgi:hypothetical protein
VASSGLAISCESVISAAPHSIPAARRCTRRHASVCLSILAPTHYFVGAISIKPRCPR